MGGSVYPATLGATTAAFTGSSRRRGRSRGRAGSKIDPEGATVQGRRWPLRHVAWRPRRLRSALKGRSYFGYGAPDLAPQLSMGVLTHGGVQSLHMTAAWGEVVEPESLRDIMASQAIRSGHQDPLTHRHGGTVPQAIHSRPVELGPAIAILPVDVLLGEMPLGRRGHLGVEALQLGLNGRRWWLTVGRHTNRAGEFPGTPPAGVLV